MTEELRPPWTTSREDPFHLSWRANLAAHGYLDLARVHGSDELLCIRLNLANPLTNVSLPNGKVNSMLILLDGDFEEIARRSSGAGPLVNLEMAAQFCEAMPKHLFKNFKYNEATQVVEWMMLKSDWINLAPATSASLEPNLKMRPPMFVKKLAKVQTAWQVQQKKYSKTTFSDDTDTGGDLATEILKITESVESYSVDLKVFGTHGKITAETKEVKNSDDRTNKLRLHFTDDKKRNKTQNVVFSCNIDPSSVQLTVTNQTIRAVVPKHKLWNTGLTMLPQLPVKPEDLPPISNIGMKKLLEEDGLLASMFLRPGDLLPWKHGLMVMDVPFAFRLCIEGIWTIAYKEPQVKVIGLGTATDILETQLDIAIKGYYFYNDLPLMHVVYQDKLVSEAMLARGDISLKDLQQKRAEKLGYRWVPYFNQVIVEPNCVSILRVEQETIDVLKRVLLQNSFRILPSNAESKFGIAESFLQLYFPRFVRGIGDHAKEMEIVAEIVGVPGDGSTCAKCGVKGKTKTCSRCKKSHYCSADCQRADWPKHREVCKADKGEKMKRSEASDMSRQETASDARAQTASGVQPTTPNMPSDQRIPPVEEGVSRGEEMPPVKEASRPKQSEPMPECKICHKSGEDLEARLVYYCSIKCHEEDQGKTYPVACAHPHPDPRAEGISGKADSGKDSLRRQPTGATKPEVKPTQKKHCDFCGRRSTTSVPCKQCSCVNYCSSSCATADWPVHGTECHRK